MKILILGKNGMLGNAVLKELHNYKCFEFGKEELDITNKEKVSGVMRDIKPNVVINCAAYTDVDACETNQKHAFNVNGKAVGHIAKSCNKIKAHLVHISTDYVFDGTKKQGYNEDDKKNPISVYGKSKAFGEDLILKNMKQFSIIRTSWLFGTHGKNFVNSIIKLSKNKNELRVVNDQVGSPTYTKDLALMIKKIVKEGKHGIFHVTNSGFCTWYQFASKIFEIMNKKVKLIPTSSKDIDRLARRPAFSILINNKLDKLRVWKYALKQYLEEDFM
jgi:dTDP-4-dehydrorhamnose reductase